MHIYYCGVESRVHLGKNKNISISKVESLRARDQFFGDVVLRLWGVNMMYLKEKKLGMLKIRTGKIFFIALIVGPVSGPKTSKKRLIFAVNR